MSKISKLTFIVDEKKANTELSEAYHKASAALSHFEELYRKSDADQKKKYNRKIRSIAQEIEAYASIMRRLHNTSHICKICQRGFAGRSKSAEMCADCNKMMAEICSGNASFIEEEITWRLTPEAPE